MPCYDPDSRSRGNDYDPSPAIDYNLTLKCNERTRMLCSVLKQLERTSFDIQMLEPSVVTWWTEHKAWDAKRAKEEQS